MKVEICHVDGQNSGKLKGVKKYVNISRDRIIYDDKSTFKLVYRRTYGFSKEYVYFISNFGAPLEEKPQGFHVSLTYLQYVCFLFIQRINWIQREENIRYLINIVLIIVGLFIAYNKSK